MPLVQIRRRSSRGSRGSRGSLHQKRRSLARAPLVSSSHSTSVMSSSRPTHLQSMAPRGTSLSAGRRVALSDQQLVALAHKTLSLIRWNRILDKPRASAPSWKWHNSRGGFDIFHKRDAHRHGVLAVGTVPCSVSELLQILDAVDANEHAQKMEALQGDAQFRHGALLHDVDLTKPSPVVPELGSPAESSLLRVCVKSATFHKTHWYSSHDQWSYVDTLHRDEESDIVEKLMISLNPEDVAMRTTSGRTKALKHVVAGYMLRPMASADDLDKSQTEVVEAPAPPPGVHPVIAALMKPLPRAERPHTQVHFYGEVLAPQQFQLTRRSVSASYPSFSSASMPTSPAPSSSLSQASRRSTKARLQAMAESCERLIELVRRRRLGVQVLVDTNRILPPTNTSCNVCARHLLVAKLCRLCGHGVCERCSQKYSRDCHVRGSQRTRLEVVRVCEPCITRVDAAVYNDLPISSLATPRVLPDDPVTTTPTTTKLIELLQDTLAKAHSKDAKAAVLSVIRTLLDQDDGARQNPSRAQRRSTRLTPASSEQAHVRALQNQLHVPVIPTEQCALANEDGREYQVRPTATVDQPMESPIPENEEHRVRVIQQQQMREMGNVEELNIICRLAAQEMDCFASMITIIDRDEQYIAASNVDVMVQQSMPRVDSCCQYAIMGDKPLVVPHTDADVRVHQSGPVRKLGLTYYCGFPVFADDRTVVGTVCCVDHTSRDLTASQYTAMTKLAETASKVIKMQTTRLRAAARA